MPKLAVIIVTHNSQDVLTQAIASLDSQSRPPDLVVIVDSGSKDTSYLSPYQQRVDCTVLFRDNIGFCAANNHGLAELAEDFDFVLFQNPDCFLTSEFVDNSLAIMHRPCYSDLGVLSGLLLGWDLKEGCPTGRVDSAGIYPTWYGRWMDRDQGKWLCEDSYSKEEPPALCGALLFCRRQALTEAQLSNGDVWNSRFFMYKDDIDLSQRVKRAGWRLLFIPSLQAYHCRGWQSDRKQMPRQARLLSARNELHVNLQYGVSGTLYSVAKYAAVFLLNR